MVVEVGFGGRFMPSAPWRRGISRLLSIPFRLIAPLRRRRIVVFYAFPDFERKSEAIADLLRRRGLPAVVQRDASFLQRARMRASSDLWIGFWNEIPIDCLPRHYVFMNAEPLSVAWWRDNPDWSLAMSQALEVWGYERSNEPFVRALGLRFVYVPFGYAPYFESTFRAHTEGKGLVEDIDVLFFGTMNARRQRVLDQLQELGLTVQTLTRANPVHGERLDELIARSKIVITVHQHVEPEAQIVDLARLDHLLSNRRFVVHESPSAVAADAAFERAVTMCRYEDIARTCAYFVARPEERASRAAAAYEWFKAERSLDAFLPYDRIIKHFNDPA